MQQAITSYETWSVNHQPFHWFVEFYGIMSKGGFDVVIGNPPYVDVTRKVRNTVCQVRGYANGVSAANLYAFMHRWSG